MILALVIGGSFLIGYAVAEVWYRISLRKYYKPSRREFLIAEYMDRQLWQFLSLDEWLDGNKS